EEPGYWRKHADAGESMVGKMESSDGCSHRHRPLFRDSQGQIRTHRGMDTPGRRTIMGNHRSVILPLLLLAICSCSRAVAKNDGPPVKKLELKYDKPVVGADVRFEATGLSAGKAVDLTWSTVTGGWVIEDNYYFRGKKYSESTASIGKFTVDASGRLSGTFKIPDDFGGVH